MEKALPIGTKVYIYKNPSGWDGSYSEEYIEGYIIDSKTPGDEENETVYVIADKNGNNHLCLHNPNSFTTEYFRTEEEIIAYLKHCIKEKEKELSNLYKETKDLLTQLIEIKKVSKKSKKLL